MPWKRYTSCEVWLWQWHCGSDVIVVSYLLFQGAQGTFGPCRQTPSSLQTCQIGLQLRVPRREVRSLQTDQKPFSPVHSTKRSCQTTRKRKSSSQLSSPHHHQQISATLKEQTTPTQYCSPHESPYLKSKRRLKSSHQKRPQDQTKSPTSFSKSATTN